MLYPALTRTAALASTASIAVQIVTTDDYFRDKARKTGAGGAGDGSDDDDDFPPGVQSDAKGAAESIAAMSGAAVHHVPVSSGEPATGQGAAMGQAQYVCAPALPAGIPQANVVFQHPGGQYGQQMPQHGHHLHAQQPAISPVMQQSAMQTQLQPVVQSMQPPAAHMHAQSMPVPAPQQPQQSFAPQCQQAPATYGQQCCAQGQQYATAQVQYSNAPMAQPGGAAYAYPPTSTMGTSTHASLPQQQQQQTPGQHQLGAQQRQMAGQQMRSQQMAGQQMMSQQQITRQPSVAGQPAAHGQPQMQTQAESQMPGQPPPAMPPQLQPPTEATSTPLTGYGALPFPATADDPSTSHQAMAAAPVEAPALRAPPAPPKSLSIFAPERAPVISASNGAAPGGMQMPVRSQIMPPQCQPGSVSVPSAMPTAGLPGASPVSGPPPGMTPIEGGIPQCGGPPHSCLMSQPGAPPNQGAAPSAGSYPGAQQPPPGYHGLSPVVSPLGMVVDPSSMFVGPDLTGSYSPAGAMPNPGPPFQHGSGQP